MLTGADLRVWHWKDNHLERKRGLLRERRRCAGQKEPSHLRFEPGVRCTVTDNAWQPDIENHVLHNSYLSFLRLPFQPFSILTLKHLVRLQEQCSNYITFIIFFFLRKKAAHLCTHWYWHSIVCSPWLASSFTFVIGFCVWFRTAHLLYSFLYDIVCFFLDSVPFVIWLFLHSRLPRDFVN